MLIKTIKIAVFAVLASVFWSGCDNEQAVPAYIHIPACTLTTTGTQGAATSKIIDAWVYVDDILIGGFRLPATFPVLKSGTAKVEVLAGVAENGNFSTPSVYPFYNFYTKTVDFKANKIDTLNPTFTYDVTKVPKFLLNDFEAADHDFTVVTGSGGATGTIVQAIDGTNKVGKITLTSGSTTNVTELARATQTRVEPDLAKSVWAEIDFKGTNSVSIGVIGYDIGGNPYNYFAEKTIFKPSANWNKGYVSLTKEMRVLKNDEKCVRFAVAINATKDANTPSTTEIFVDNIKLLYY